MQFDFGKIFIVVISVLIMTVAGCRSNPVLNIEDAAVVTGKSQASADEVKNAIMLAGKSLGWVMKPGGAGSILATLNLRKHMAVVDIKYNTKTYSIIYKNSQYLDYDGTNIHGNYNGWVQRLNQAIQVQLSGV
ncbi:MAG: hypothetical protein NUV51_05010 [Sulfuricaulis sp.]|nr:hypothetical protein [Sulfuricaulis sp.]